MFQQTPEVPALLLLCGCAVASATAAFQSRRDLFDPRVFFVLIYAYLIAAPYLFSLVFGQPYHPGLKTRELPAVLISCTSAMLAFSLGASLAIAGLRKRRTVTSIGPRDSDQLTNDLIRSLLIVLASVAIVGFCYFGWRIRAAAPDVGASKAVYLAYANVAEIRSFRICGAVCMLTLTLFIIVDALMNRKALTLVGAALLGSYGLACFLSGERDVLLLAVIWLTSNWRKLNRRHIVGVIAVSVLWLGISPMLRQHGLGLGMQFVAVQNLSFVEWLRSITHVSGSVHVFTNVVDAVPAIEPHWHGRSLLGAMASFLPGDFALKDETPAIWFKGIYDHQRVASFAFSQDAEAYLNFGWFGPPAWFGVWGYLLGVVYRRAIVHGRTIDVFIWWHCVATSMFAVRSDTRPLFKLVLGGIAVGVVLWKVGEVVAKHEARAGPHPVRRNSGPTTSITSP